MNNSIVNFTTPETSTNTTTHSIEVTDIVTVCIFFFNFLFGLPTHSIVIWLIVKGTRSGIASKTFFLNLSVCEIGNCVNCLFFIASYFFSSMAALPLFLLGLVFTGRPLFQTLICVERYLAVVHPVTFLKFKPLRYRLICCAVAWNFTLSTCFFSLFQGVLHARLLSLQFMLSLSVQLFCLVAVLRALKRSGPGDRKREEENHMKRRAFRIILITTVSMAIIYVPFTITGLITILINQSISVLWITGLICYVLAGFVQPVLYLHHTGKLSCFSSFVK